MIQATYKANEEGTQATLTITSENDLPITAGETVRTIGALIGSLIPDKEMVLKAFAAGLTGRDIYEKNEFC